MAVAVTTWILAAAGLYLAVGLAFAPFFVVRGARRIDPAAAGGTWGFRVLVFPGVVALWPLLARRWARGVDAPPEERGAHRSAAREAGTP